MFLFISLSYRRLEGMMKRNMRVTSPRVGDPNPQTAGWFNPQADTETAPARVTAAEFDRWISDISNWGRWGKDDELGTLNLITMAKRKAASRLVRVGVSLSLELDLNKQKEGMNSNPFIHYLTTSVWGGHEIAGDTYSVEYHGFAHSHMDGLLTSLTTARCTTASPWIR